MTIHDLLDFHYGPDGDTVLRGMLRDAGSGNCAACSRSVAPVTFLIDAGADLEAPGLDGGTSLHQAAWFGQPDHARVLIDAGPGLRYPDEDDGNAYLRRLLRDASPEVAAVLSAAS